MHVEARVFISLFLKPLVFKCLKLLYLYIDSCGSRIKPGHHKVLYYFKSEFSES